MTAVLLGGVELRSVALLRAGDERRVARTHLPGLDGDVVQDLGRGPVCFRLDGVLAGDSANQTASALLGQFRGGVPVELVASLGATLEARQVLIRAMELRDEAGWPALIRFRAELIEYVDPPQPEAVNDSLIPELPSLDAGDLAGDLTDGWQASLETSLTIEAASRDLVNDPFNAAATLADVTARGGDLAGRVIGDAAARLAGNTGNLSSFLAGAPPAALADMGKAVAGALHANPGALAGALTAVSAGTLAPVLANLGGGDLATAIAGAAGGLSGGQIGALLSTVASSPGKLADVVGALGVDPSGIATVVQGVVASPSLVTTLIQEVPGALASFGAEGIAQLGRAVGGLAAGDFASALSSVGGADLGKAGDMIGSIREAGDLGAVAKRMVGAGWEELRDRIGLDPSQLPDALRALYDGADLLDELRKVASGAGEILAALRGLAPAQIVASATGSAR